MNVLDTRQSVLPGKEGYLPSPGVVTDMLIALLLAAASPVFDPFGFFAGQTRGEGQLKVILHGPVAVAVQGSGAVDADGTLILDQIVQEGAKPPRPRQWRLRRTAPDHYEGSLTDASGKVIADVNGSVLHVRFKAAGNIQIQQWLTLSADGRSAANRLVARRFGLTVATLAENIIKLDRNDGRETACFLQTTRRRLNAWTD